MYWNEAGEHTEEGRKKRLIETWDVLKSGNYIGCSLLHKINRNMRCIEIWSCRPAAAILLWLIETWDVLKSLSTVTALKNIGRLIETWDVLKWYSSKSFFIPFDD